MYRISERLGYDNWRAYWLIWPDNFRENIVIAEFKKRKVKNYIFLKWTFEIVLGEIQLIVWKIHGRFNRNVIFIWILCFWNLGSEDKRWSTFARIIARLYGFRSIFNDDGSLLIILVINLFSLGWWYLSENAWVWFYFITLQAHRLLIHGN